MKQEFPTWPPLWSYRLQLAYSRGGYCPVFAGTSRFLPPCPGVLFFQSMSRFGKEEETKTFKMAFQAWFYDIWGLRYSKLNIWRIKYPITGLKNPNSFWAIWRPLLWCFKQPLYNLFYLVIQKCSSWNLVAIPVFCVRNAQKNWNFSVNSHSCQKCVKFSHCFHVCHSEFRSITGGTILWLL